VDLKAKLGLLGAPSALERGRQTPFAPALPAPTELIGPDRALTLEALRRKMAAILGRPGPVARSPADPSQTELPFARVATDAGPLYVRRERLPPSYHVGRIPVDAAAAARAEVLALLALDPGLARCDPRRAVFLDTETTGLGQGAGIVAFLVGLAFFDDDGQLWIEQLLLRSLGEEVALLRRLDERLATASLVVTYNGKTFDLPLLASRRVMNRLRPLGERPHLDLLHVARRLHKERLGACRLVGLESEVLGFVRDADIDGGEIAPRYAHFLRTGDEAALAAVVQHNAWDVVAMAALMGLYGEPLGALHDEDLVGLARVLRRAGALERAAEAADAAVERGVGPRARQVRAQIAKARGDRARALSDFEVLSGEMDDASVRLELAKLYEHHVKEPLKALELVREGTGEGYAESERRRSRLERKVARQAEQMLRQAAGVARRTRRR
jgi:uncharacterized protein YprB with RNaseH-like and TPR domain